MAKSVLGKGLGAIISGRRQSLPPAEFKLSDGQKTTEQNIEVTLIDANPAQPRRDFNDESLNELAASIKEHGIIQPLVVSRKGDHYELLAGERRLLAAKRVGLKVVPVVIRKADQQSKAEVALVENIQRQDLNPIEIARGYNSLIHDFNLTQDQVAQKVGKSRSAVANTLRLLELPRDIQKGLRQGKISEGHAKAILSLTSPEKQRALYARIVRQDLNVREAEFTIKKIKIKPHLRTLPAQEEVTWRTLADQLAKYLGTKVRLKKVAKGGRLEIEFYSHEELSEISRKIIK